MDQNDAKLLKMIQYRVGLIHRKITEKIFEKKQTHHSIREKQESSFIFRPKKIMHGEDKCFELKVEFPKRIRILKRRIRIPFFQTILDIRITDIY